MSIHFITVLGTSLYTDCIYEIEEAGFACRTPFAQMATLKYIVSQQGRCGRITVFVTEQSERNNWVSREYTPKEREILAGRHIEVKPGEIKTGLKELLETEFPDACIDSVRIREGRNKEEIDEIFESMYSAIEPDETIYFDFTHGLRNIPMQALTVIHYGKILKNIQVGGMYYGAFELGRQGEDGLKHVSLLDMSACSAILDWTSAAESFIKGGSSNQIEQLYKKRVKQGIEVKYSSNTLKRLTDLTNCLNTSRGKSGSSEKSSIRRAYEYFKMNYHEMQDNREPVSEKPLLRLFEKIEEDVEIFDRKCYVEKEGEKIWLEETATGMAAVEWAIRKGLTQQGFTALEETLKTYVCELHQISAEGELTRDTIVGDTVKLIAARYNSGKKKQGKAAENLETRTLLDRTELKEERRRELLGNHWFMELEEQEREFYIQKAEEMVDGLPVELANLTSEVVPYRNTLNHFGFQKQKEEMRYKKIQEKLEELYGKLRKIMEEMEVKWE